MTESGRGEAKPQTPKNHGDNGAQLPKFIAEFLGDDEGIEHWFDGGR
jgi:hypothetical protein